MQAVSFAFMALLAVNMVFVQPGGALTFKKDGSVVQKDGTVVRRSDKPEDKPPEPLKSSPSANGPATGSIAAGRIPDWCGSPPENTVFRISACGTADAASLSIAKSRALLDAKRQLADVVNAAVEFANENVANSAEEVPIRGYRRLAEETVTIKGRTHHFVLLQMEIGPAAELMTRSLEYSIERFGRTCPEGWKKVDNGCVVY